MGPQPEPNQDTKKIQELQLQKATLENEKLKMEIRNLKRRWPLFAPYVTGTLTIIAIATGSFIAYLNSEWKRDAESARSEAKTMQGQKASLEIQIAAGKKELGTLQPQITALRTQATKARQEADAARSQREILEQRSRDIQSNIQNWREQILQASGRVQSAANLILTGTFSDSPTIQYSQVNRVRADLQKIADAMLTISVPSGAPQPKTSAKPAH
jgi:FtsZ-binding cell division protein ZapB